MSVTNRFRVDASPLSAVAANAWLHHESADPDTRENTRLRDAIDRVKRAGQRSRDTHANYHLPSRLWVIVAIALLAWAIVAIPAVLLFG